MVDAGGTTTLTKITNVGPYMLMKLSNDSWDSTETIPLDITDSPVAAEDQVLIVGALNETTESQLGGSALTVEYDETAMHFTGTESGATADVLSIWFYLLKN